MFRRLSDVAPTVVRVRAVLDNQLSDCDALLRRVTFDPFPPLALHRHAFLNIHASGGIGFLSLAPVLFHHACIVGKRWRF